MKRIKCLDKYIDYQTLEKTKTKNQNSMNKILEIAMGSKKGTEQKEIMIQHSLTS